MVASAVFVVFRWVLTICCVMFNSHAVTTSFLSFRIALFFDVTKDIAFITLTWTWDVWFNTNFYIFEVLIGDFKVTNIKIS